MTNPDWLYIAQPLLNLAVLIAFIIVGFIQKQRIDSIQKVTENMSRFMSIFDLDKVEKYVKMNAETSKIEMERIQQEAKKRVEESIQQTARAFPSQMEELLVLLGNLFLYVPPSVRMSIIEKSVKDKDIKKQLQGLREIIGDQYLRPYSKLDSLKAAADRFIRESERNDSQNGIVG